MKKQNDIQWLGQTSFRFVKGTRPAWTTAAKKIPLVKGEDRRHGLHGNEVITKAAEIILNHELQKSGREKTKKKLYTNLKSRGVPLKRLEQQELTQLISTFRKYAFSKATNLLPGDGDYNKAIEAVRKKVVTLQKKLHMHFFSQGATADEIALKAYKAYLLKALRTKSAGSKSRRQHIIDDITSNVLIPLIKQSQDILAVDRALTAIADTTKIDIGFSQAKCFKGYNQKILKWDARIKRGLISEEGLTQGLFNTLIGYRPRRKKA